MAGMSGVLLIITAWPPKIAGVKNQLQPDVSPSNQ